MELVELKEAIDGWQTSATAALEQNAKDVKALTDEVDKIQVILGRPGVAMMYRGANNDVAAERKALGGFVKTGSDAELKSMSVGSDPSGGYVVLPKMAASMIKRIFDASPIRRLARVQQIDSGDAWAEPLDLNDASAEWVGEEQARPELATPDLSMLTVPLNELYSLQKLTQKLLDLASIDLGAWVEQKLADKFARTEGLAFVSGNGVGRAVRVPDVPDLDRCRLHSGEGRVAARSQRRREYDHQRRPPRPVLEDARAAPDEFDLAHELGDGERRRQTQVRRDRRVHVA